MFLPATIDLGQSEKYILSLRIKPTGFMFSFTEPNVGRHYCLRETVFETDDSLLENIQKIIFELNFLTLQYSRTNVVFVDTDYSLVPTPFFEKKNKEALLDFTIKNENSHVLTNEIPRYDVNILYKINPEVYEFLARSLYNPQFYHHSALLIDVFEGKARTTSLHSKMYLNIQEDQIDIVCFNQDKLILSLSYNEFTPYEQTYHVLKVWETLGFNQTTDMLLVSGEMDERVLTPLRLYIKNIERVALPSEVYLWHKDVQKAPIDLLALSL